MTRYQTMEAKTIGEPQGEVETKALLHTLAYILAKFEAESLVGPVVVTLA